MRERLTAAGATVAIAPLPREPGRRYQPPNVTEPELKARSFAGLLPESWRVGSFTAVSYTHLDVYKRQLYTPLTGLNFIEASAGTGKTYTITALYLRLVMELSLIHI